MSGARTDQNEACFSSEKVELRLDAAIEGLLATNRAVPEGNYLELAKRMADRLLAWQTPAGGWNFIADQPVKKVGISEKGTTLWSYRTCLQ